MVNEQVAAVFLEFISCAVSASETAILQDMCSIRIVIKSLILAYYEFV